MPVGTSRFPHWFQCSGMEGELVTHRECQVGTCGGTNVALGVSNGGGGGVPGILWVRVDCLPHPNNHKTLNQPSGKAPTAQRTWLGGGGGSTEPPG